MREQDMRAMTIMFAMISCGLVGCGGSSLPPPVPVSGKVTLAGKPVDGAVVTFLSTDGGRSASGTTGSDGSFKLTTINTNDGARPGEYTVTISKTESKVGGAAEIDVAAGEYGDAYGAMMGAAAKGGDMSKVMKSMLPEKYANAAESGLKRTVVKGEENDFLIDL
jgi:hypothetical protein